MLTTDEAIAELDALEAALDQVPRPKPELSLTPAPTFAKSLVAADRITPGLASWLLAPIPKLRIRKLPRLLLPW